MPESFPDNECKPDIPKPPSESSSVPPEKIPPAQDPFEIAGADILPRMWGMQERTTRDVQHSLESIRPFDLAIYEAVVEHSTCRELTPEDWEAIGDLYTEQEIPEGTFQHIFEGQIPEAEMDLQKGGMVDRWQPSPKERQALEAVNPHYLSSGDEFRNFLEGKHGRAAEFRSWGIFNEQGRLSAMAGSFLPPRDPAKHVQHGEEVRSFFLGTSPMHFRASANRFKDIPDYLARAETTGEFYIIIARRRGEVAVVLKSMFQQIERERYDITDWYLLRFGSLTTVTSAPEMAHHADDADNAASKRCFKKLGFGTCGECSVEDLVEGRDLSQVAAREVGDIVVVVHPTWKVMRATHEVFQGSNKTEMQHLHARAKEVRAAMKKK